MKIVALALLAVVAAVPVRLQHPIFHTSDNECQGHCSIPGTHTSDVRALRNVLCSHEGRRRMLECATCIDRAWPIDSPLDETAMSEYRRVMSACDEELFNE